MEKLRNIVTRGKILDFKPPEEIERGHCSGCDQDYILFKGYIAGGQDKGKEFTYKRGCCCQEKELAQQTLEAHKRMKQRKMIELFKTHSLINNKLRHCTFDNFDPKTESQENALRLSKEFAKDVKSGNYYNLLFSGSYGIGKSHLAVAAIRVLMSYNISCAFVTVPKLMRKIRDTYNKNSTVTENEIMSGLEALDVLVLDDIGAETETDWTSEKIFEIVDARAGKANFYTTNLSSDDLNEHLGSRNFSRLMDDTKTLTLFGEDLRLRGF